MNDFFIFVSAFVGIVGLVTLANVNRAVQNMAARVEAMAQAHQAIMEALKRLESTPEYLKKMAGVLAQLNFQVETMDHRLGGGLPKAKDGSEAPQRS